MPHIVTVTVNPALDIHTSVPRLVPSDKMRCGPVRYDPGGGGVNVARTAVRLGVPTTAVIVVGGHTGQRLQDLLVDPGLELRTVRIAEPTRESMVVVDENDGACYRFVLPGPRLRRADEIACLHAVDDAARTATHLVVSGSLPPGCSRDFFRVVARIADRARCTLVVDTPGTTLRHVVGAHLVKPSVRELGDFVGAPLPDRPAQVAAARDVIAAGVSRVVVVSRGVDGALVVTADDAHDIAGVPVEPGVGTGVGCGDSMVAAITVALARGRSLVEAVRYGTAAGAAAMLTPGTEPCRAADVDRLDALAGTA